MFLKRGGGVEINASFYIFEVFLRLIPKWLGHDPRFCKDIQNTFKFLVIGLTSPFCQGQRILRLGYIFTV